MIPFDAIQCPLSGVNLIEASAGTGKTHALTALYLRFILEAKITPDRILVITYTKAATAELKRRIRKMLQEAQTAFTTGNAENSFLLDILNQYPTASARKKIADRLLRALANFDEAAIHTIHGFCQRILVENAFESSTMFDVEPIDNQQELELEFVEDFWRRNFYQNDPTIVCYALSRNINKAYFLQLLKSAMNKPTHKIIPDYQNFAADNLKNLRQTLDQKFLDFRELWQNQRNEIVSCLQSKALHANVYGKKADKIASEIDKIILLDNVPLPLPQSLNKVNHKTLCEKTKKNEITPEHPAFSICDDLCSHASQLQELLDIELAGLKKKFLEELLMEFPKMKQRKNVLYFDDLLVQARNALLSGGGDKLAHVLRDKYKAVLIDEFQDTDPVQFAILQTIFIQARSENAVFYIGDPKQAIYSFRGADIFAYLRASADITSKYTMRENWRSEASLLNAINVLFSNTSRPFVFDEIEYNPIMPAKEALISILRFEGKDNIPLQWWFMPAGVDEKPLNMTETRDIIIRAVVAEISRLLLLGRQNKAFIGINPLQESDIAILVRKNFEAVTFQKTLAAAGIPAVLFSAQSVFNSEEAEELERLLRGIIYFENEGYLLAALATPFFNLQALDLSACIKDESALIHWQTRFHEYHEIWRDHGFLKMFYLFLDREHVRSRIISASGGERHLTNYLHLAQELHIIQEQENLNFYEVVKRLSEMRNRDDAAAENEQLRLSTDKNCVRIVTIHKSKGLEYPIVFCPFAWETSRKKNESMPLFFHDDKNNWQLTADLGSNMLAANIAQYEWEILAEECRLLYVALTRAKNRCYFVSGKIKNIEDSAVSYLFHQPRGEAVNETSEGIFCRLVELSQAAPQAIRVTKIAEVGAVQKLPEEEKEESLNFQPFIDVIDQSWKIASFTYLTSLRQPHDEEIKHTDDDSELTMQDIKLAEAREYENMLNFPGGTTSGILLHEILEGLNFSQAGTTDADSLILEALEKYGYSPLWLGPINSMLASLVNVRLKEQGEGEFSLVQLANSSILKEMEFYFPIRDIAPEKIRSVLTQCAIFQKDRNQEGYYPEKLNFPQISGLLKGFIDIIFEFQGKYYLADWKSNYLGDDYEDYSPAAVLSAMAGSSYVLQYLIYTVALDQYLRKRISNYNYEEHFGGVYYFFLRGLGKDAGEESGIYYDRPSAEIIRQLKEVLLP
ncbi:MAG: exodeoxyribonuclease V subunit beta [Smithella sp.]